MIIPIFDSYKDAVCERSWKVPNHWDVVPCRAIVEQRTDKNEGGKISEYLSLMANVGIIRYEDKGDIGNKKPDDLSKCKIVRRGDLVINSMNYGIGSYGLSPLDGVCSPVYIVLDPIPSMASERFALRIFEEKEFQAFAQSFGNGILAHRSAISWDDLKNIKVGLPPLAEQTQIARFLDHKTARIDALIEQQQRLIELLKEKRQAVISHAVTKGLDRTVPMKDSGVEWLGVVPAHWVISQLKFKTLEMQTGPFGSQLHADEYVVGGVPLVNPAHMIDGKIVPDPHVSVDDQTSERLQRHALAPGDIIFARRGELGRCAIVAKDQEGWLCGTGSLKAKLSNQIEAEYAYILITSQSVVAELSLESKGSTMENLNTETLGRVRLPVPPVSEQKEILEYVHNVSGRFEELIDTAMSSTALISERRSALISAAVSGKIDVRNWQPPTSVSKQETQQELAHG